MMTYRWSLPTIVVLMTIQWSAVALQAGDILCEGTHELCLSKRFLRFGRGLSPDPYYKIGRQFFRLNRSYQPYQDKRFLRFGRSQLQGLDDIYDADVGEPFSRKRRSLDTDSQLDVTHNHVRRSVDQSAIEQSGNDHTSKTIKKRSNDDQSLLTFGQDSRDETSKMIKKRSIDEKPFRVFGRDFTREDDSDDNEGFGKRFMRIGKRIIPAKRFMRFGRNHGIDSNSDILAAPIAETAKRFMRFGKRKNIDNSDDESMLKEANMHKLSDVLSLANRLKSEAAGIDGGVFGSEKRFMRFGKRDAEVDELENES